MRGYDSGYNACSGGSPNADNYNDGYEKGYEDGLDQAEVGLKYYQEIAPGIAEDIAEIMSVNNTLDTPSGTFKQVLKTEETNPLKPGEKENKFYAPGIGLIQDEAIKLVNYTKP